MMPIRRFRTKRVPTSCCTSVSRTIPFSAYLVSERIGTERQLGGLEVILPYIRNYVETYRGKSIRTDEWKLHLFKYFAANGGQEKLDILNAVDWQVGYDNTSRQHSWV